VSDWWHGGPQWPGEAADSHGSMCRAGGLGGVRSTVVGGVRSTAVGRVGSTVVGVVWSAVVGGVWSTVVGSVGSVHVHGILPHAFSVSSSGMVSVVRTSKFCTFCEEAIVSILQHFIHKPAMSWRPYV